MDLCGVRSNIHLLGGTALVLGVDDHPVPGQTGIGHGAPFDGEGGGGDLGKFKVGGGRDG